MEKVSRNVHHLRHITRSKISSTLQGTDSIESPYNDDRLDKILTLVKDVVALKVGDREQEISLCAKPALAVTLSARVERTRAYSFSALCKFAR